MPLNGLVTAKVTHEVLTRVLSLLSSAAAPLSGPQIKALVTAQLEHHPKLRYAQNNDLGLCVGRLLEGCSLAGITTAAALEQSYTSILQDDAIVSELIGQVAEGIAAKLSAPLYDVRTALPQEAKALAETIARRLPDDVRSGNPLSLRQFDWGKLGTEQGRSMAMLFAKDRLPCFKRATPQYYDTDNILQVLPYGAVTAITDAPAVRAALTTAIAAQLTAEANNTQLAEFQALAIELILSPQAYRKWALSAAQSLKGDQLSMQVVALTDTIDAVEDLLRCVNATTLNALSATNPATATSLVSNIETVLANTQLLRAALVYHKEHTLAGQLLLSPTTVQADVLTHFCADGGSEAMVQDYLAYTKLNDHITIPKKGISAEIIRALHPRAQETLVTQNARLLAMAEAHKTSALQTAILTGLEVYNQIGLRDITRAVWRKQDTHIQQINKAMATLKTRPLEDIALEYLVSMRDNALTGVVYKAVNTELLALMQRSTAIGKQDIAQATCVAITRLLLDRLNKRFAARIAA